MARTVPCVRAVGRIEYPFVYFSTKPFVGSKLM